MNPIFIAILLSCFVVAYFSHYSLISIYTRMLTFYTLFSFIYLLFKKNTTSQKIIISSWEHPNNPCLMLPFIWECDRAIKYIEETQKTNTIKISLTDYFIYACYYAMQYEPEFNGRIHFGNYKISEKEETSIIQYSKSKQGFHIVKFTHPYIYQLCEIALRRRTEKKYPDKRIKNIFLEFICALLPPFLLQPIVYLLGYLNKNLELNINCDGIGKGGIGNVLLINYGKEGFESIALPMSSFCQASCTLAMGKSQKIPRIEDGKIVAKNCIEVNLYVDHRYTDGTKGSNIYKKVK